MYICLFMLVIGEAPGSSVVFCFFTLGRWAIVAALSALVAALAESGYVNGLEMDLGLPLLLAMAPLAARRLFWRSKVGMGSRGLPVPPAEANAWLAAELPHPLAGIDLRFAVRLSFALSAARTAAVLDPGALAAFGGLDGLVVAAAMLEVVSFARLAALCAGAFLLLSGVHGATGLVLAQPSEAAALAAASSFLRPSEGYEGRSLGSAYLMRPARVPAEKKKGKLGVSGRVKDKGRKRRVHEQKREGRG